MKKCALFLSILICFLLFLPGVCPAETEEGTAVALVNPGFEDGLNWLIMGNTPQAMLETEKAHTGSNSLKIHNTEGNNPWVAQYVSKPMPRAIYTVSVWMNTDLDKPSKGAGIKIEQYDSSGGYIREGSFDFRQGVNTNNRWQKLEGSFQVMENAYRVKILLRCYSEGTAWYDDVEMHLSGGPEPYSCYMDHIFHYPDEKEGSVTISVDSFYAVDSEEAENVSAYFYFLDTDGKTVLDQKEDVSFVNREVTYTYPVSLMKNKTAQYKLRAELRDKEMGETVREWTENKYVYDRPEWMPENGKFIIDGEPFYPIMGYHVDPEQYPFLYENGKPVINTVQLGVGAAGNDERNTYVMSELAKYPEIKGLYSLYPNSKTAAHPDNIEKTKARVTALKDNPQILAWIVMDEPLGGGVEIEERKAQLELAYREIRAIDPKRPVYLLDYGTAHMETIKYCDVFVADVYQRGVSAKAVSQVIEPLTKKHTRLSTYELACAFKSGGIFPPVRTIRASVYRGLEAGGSYGTGFYSIQDAIGHDKGDEDKALYLLDEWEPITKLCQEELPILFAHYDGDGGTSFNTCRTGTLYEECLWETWIDKNGAMYLLAHNRSDQTETLHIPLKNAAGNFGIAKYTAEPVGITETGARNGDGEITLTLEQEQIVLYKITPHSVRLYDKNEDIYMGVYTKDGRELLAFSALKHGDAEKEVPLQGENYMVKVFAFEAEKFMPKGEVLVFKEGI